MQSLLVALLLFSALFIVSLAILSHEASATVFFQEEFLDSSALNKTWVKSKYSDEYGNYRWASGKWYGKDRRASKGLQTTSDNSFYAFGAKFPQPFSNAGRDLIIQYSVKHEQLIECGGAYMKLLPSSVDLENFSGKSPYYIMFGPDICGPRSKVAFILNIDGEEFQWKKDLPAENTSRLTHYYTAVLHPNNTYSVHIDGVKRWSGKVIDHWDVAKSKRIAGNPDALATTEWYRFDDIGAIGFDLWQVKAGTVFDNIIITDSWDEANAHLDKTNQKAAEKIMFEQKEEKRRQKEIEQSRKMEAERRKRREEEERRWRRRKDAHEDEEPDEFAEIIRKKKEQQGPYHDEF